MFPRGQIEVQNTTTDLDARTGRAVVLTTIRVTELFQANSNVRESVNNFRWKRVRYGRRTDGL